MDLRGKKITSEIGVAHAIFTSLFAIAMHLMEKPASTLCKVI